MKIRQELRISGQNTCQDQGNKGINSLVKKVAPITKIPLTRWL